MSNLIGIGQSGLSASKKQMSTTAHNIANVNTEGFSRKRADLQTNRPIGRSNTVMGTGVDVSSIKRIHDNLIEKKLINAKTEHSYHEERSFHLNQMENVLNESSEQGLTKVMGDFFNAFRELSTQPENETMKNLVRDKALVVTHDFNRIAQSIADVENNIDNRAKLYVEDINGLLENIKNLNIKITELEVSNGETGDLRDQRDLSVKKLSEYFEVETSVNERNQYSVNVIGVGSLVVGGLVQKIEASIQRSDINPEGSDIKIFFKDKSSGDLANLFQRGKLKALIETKAQEINKTQNELDKLAFNLAESTNAIHRKGFINTDLPLDSQGRLPASLGNLKITDVDFFKKPLKLDGAARQLSLSNDITNNALSIAVAAQANAPGDNRIAIAISKLQNEKLFNNNTASLEEEYVKSIASIGLATSKSNINEEQSKGLLAQVETLRERVSGVSLDEEATQMMQYQHAYQASARVIKASEDMFNSLLQMIRP